MSTGTITNHDLDRLRGMVDIADDSSGSSAVDVTFAVLDQVREVVGGDWATFQDMQGAARRIRHLQWTTGENYATAGIGDFEGDDIDPFWKYYQSSACSLPDRVSNPMVVSLREVYGEQEWAQHPMHLEALPDVHDEILAAWPCGPGMNVERTTLGRPQ